MARPKGNPTIQFVLGLYREMKTADRRTLMLALTDASFDVPTAVAAPRTVPRAKQKGGPSAEQTTAAESGTQ